MSNSCKKNAVKVKKEKKKRPERQRKLEIKWQT